MTLEEMQYYYPIEKTLVGFYGSDGEFVAHCFDDIKDIDRWDYAPLDWGEGVIPFIEYLGNNKFKCCYFSYQRLKGYYTETGNTYKLVTDWGDLGIDISSIYEYDDQHIIITPDTESYKNLEEASQYENMVETVAYAYDSKAYHEGRIFTTYDKIKNFVNNMNENKEN